MRILFGDRIFLPRNLRYLSSKNVSYKETLNMPKSKFASTMKNRVKCEKDIRKVSRSIILFSKKIKILQNQSFEVFIYEFFQKYPVNDLWQWQSKQSRRPLFILHDGPPFANGPLHIGHFLNKVRLFSSSKQFLLLANFRFRKILFFVINY